MATGPRVEGNSWFMTSVLWSNKMQINQKDDLKKMFEPLLKSKQQCFSYPFILLIAALKKEEYLNHKPFFTGHALQPPSSLKSHLSMSDHITGLLILSGSGRCVGGCFITWRSEGVQLPPLQPNPKEPHSPPVSLHHPIPPNAASDVAITQIHVD